MKTRHNWIENKYLQAFFELSLKHYGNPVYSSSVIYLLQLFESVLISAVLLLNSRTIVWGENIRQMGYLFGLVFDVR